MQIFFCSFSVYSWNIFLIYSASVRSIPFLSFIGSSLHEMFPWYLLFSWRVLWSFPFYCFPLFLCINCWGRLSSLSLLLFGTLHWDVYIFPFLLCFSLLFFSQLFVRPPQTTILPFCISFAWGWSWSLLLVQFHKPPSIVLQALCLLDIIPWIYLPFYCIVRRDLI